MKNIEVKSIHLDNNEIYTYRYYLGGEKIMVLVHGNLASSKFYEQLINDLPKEYTIYAVDLRGFGGSTYNRPIDTLRDLEGDLKLFVDKLNLKSFDLLGWSTGGAVSMLFTASYGYLVNRLFLIASAGVSGYHSYRKDENNQKILLKSKQEISFDPIKIKQLEALQKKDKVFYKNMWDKAIYNINKPSPKIYEKQLDESLRQRNLIDIYHGLNQFNISDYYSGLSMGGEEVKLITQPTTIIQGEDDLLVSVKTAKELKAAIGSNANLVLIKNCGHSPMVDAPEILLNVILKNH